MYALFEEAGKFMAGRILSEADASAQVELDSGKRVKVKAAHILLKFEKPAPSELIAQAQAAAQTIELELAYEFAPEDEFGFADLARDYFSDNATLVQQAGALFRLYEAPHYFRRAGKGRFKKAPAEIVQQALLAIEKKKLVLQQITNWAEALARNECPQPIRDQLYKILFKPDKNAPEYKAVVEASRATQTAPLDLLQRAGAIDSPYQFHWKRFLFENFPKGTGFPALEAPAIKDELPLADVQAYSIDDSQTTEIDYALSLQGLGSGTVVLGIHIAAPGLALQPGGAVDNVARHRLSTVYMPGYKITMLPDEVVQAYTLDAGRANPAVSLYVTYDEASLDVLEKTTRLERVPVAHNFRHDQLDHIVTEEHLAQDISQVQVENIPQSLKDVWNELSFLHKLAQHLKHQREVVRGKPENFSRPDYSFRLQGNGKNEPDGSETVQISTRKRGSPLDLIVAEAAIVANSSWGQMLADFGVPGIYRSQASMAPGVKVRMSTSPLRRYVDLVNQWQVIACARHGATAALAAPFKPKDADLFSIISNFEATYGAYNSYQAGMERFWTLKYLEQNGITEIDGALIRDDAAGGALVRAETLPLVVNVLGAQGMGRGARVRVKLGQVDLISLDIHGTVVARLDDPQDPSDDAPLDAEDDGDGAEVTAGPIAIAVDVNEADSPDNPTP